VVVGETVTVLGRIGTGLRPTSGRVGIFLEGGQNSLVACVHVLTHVSVPVICDWQVWKACGYSMYLFMHFIDGLYWRDVIDVISVQW
jgi:hypothetical protein